MYRPLVVLVATLIILTAAPARAQDEIDRNVYTTARREAPPPDVDGRLNDEIWQNGGWYDDFVQQQPVEGAVPSERTAFKIVYDDRYLYIGMRAYDTQPDQISRQVARRDVFAGDMMGVAFDSYHDHRTAYEFNMSAAGAKIDLLMKGTWEFDTTWDAVWDGATALEDSAWTAEMRVPLSQLRFSDDEEQVWGLHVWRWMHRLGEEAQFQLLPRDGVGTVYHFGELHGIRGLDPQRRVELLPYTMGKVSTFEPEDGNPFADGTGQRAGLGLDAKVGITSAFTLDLTLNPDFGQVEADPSVINLSAFETFYEEKRPFFLEGSNLFAFRFEGNAAFYSRRIGGVPHYHPSLDEDEYVGMPDVTTILGAAKLTGKTRNGLSVGVLESLTSRESAPVEGPYGRRHVVVEPLTNYFVGRVEKEFDEGNTVLGGLLTSVYRSSGEDYLDFVNREAYVGGVNFTHYWGNRTYFVDAMAVASGMRGEPEALIRAQRSSARYFQRPDADYVTLDSSRTSLWGQGVSVEVGREGNSRFRYSGDLSWASPGLDFNDAGFMRRTDRINADARFAYVRNAPTRFFRRYETNVRLSTDWNFGGDVTRRAAELGASAQFHNHWGLWVGLDRELEALDAWLLRGGPGVLVPGGFDVRARVSTDSRKDVDFSLGMYVAMQDEDMAEAAGVEPTVSWRVNEAISLNAEVGFERVRNGLQYVDRIARPGGDTYLLGRLEQQTLSTVLRLSWSLRPDLVLQFYGQPFMSTGRYDRFKTVEQPLADRFADRVQALAPDRVVRSDDSKSYSVFSDQVQEPDYSFENPDFNFRELRTNLVMRWEYRPGSILYLVWSQSRSDRDEASARLYRRAVFDVRDEVDRLFGIYPHNVFAVKLRHYFSV